MSDGMRALELATQENQRITWQVAHEALSRLARERAAADAEEGRWLLAAERAAVHVHLGYGAFSEYVERMFGYKPRSLQEKLRVAEALEGLPIFAQALSSGEVSWSAVRELTRVTVRETEQEWLDFARGKTLRQLEQVLAGKRSGDTPASAPDLSAQRHVLRFDVAAETFALFRDALSELRRRADAALDDDSALLEMARCVLGGPRDEGRASYQVVLSVCPECGSGQQHANGGLVPVGPEVTRMACCDAQHVGPIADGSSAPANDLEPDDSRDDHAGTPDPAAAVQDAHVGTSTQRSSRPIENVSETSRPQTGARVPPRAKQTIPPALRRAVLLRDQHRCQVPGCTNMRWLDVHHIELRSEGGRHSLKNLTGLCSAHHRAAHRGKITLARSESGALRVRHADGTEYGGRVKPQVLEVRAKVFSALRNLGFREAQVRAALEQLQREPVLEQASFDGLLREALARLRPSRV
jgi:5-methylcytosine-specific restriction endonuclease McrA